MLNSSSLNAVNSSRFSQHFVRPLYDSYCFANLPDTIFNALTGEGQSAFPGDIFGDFPTRYSRVVLFFIDAFGWRFFSQFAEKYPFLKTVLREGSVSKITSQFPSTTAAHVTCIHTGLNVGQSGIYEWHYYEPLVDAIITLLQFSYAGDNERDTLKRAGLAAEVFYPRHTFYQKLQQRGIPSYIFQHQAYTPSTSSNVFFQGASAVIPFKNAEEALSRVTERLMAAKEERGYYFLYYDRLDAMGHVHGPQSPQFLEEAERFFTLLEHLFFKKTRGAVADTLFLLTADHGQIEVQPEHTYYLNKHIPDIARFFQTNRKGKLLVPAGSARDMFLHVQPSLLDEAIATLRQHLQGRAEVYAVRELIEQGLFSSRTQQVSPEFLGRVGNVVILPYPGETVWWLEPGKFDMHFRGHHGGLTPAEMEIPLLLMPLSE